MILLLYWRSKSAWMLSSSDDARCVILFVNIGTELIRLVSSSDSEFDFVTFGNVLFMLS